MTSPADAEAAGGEGKIGWWQKSWRDLDTILYEPWGLKAGEIMDTGIFRLRMLECINTTNMIMVLS